MLQCDVVANDALLTHRLQTALVLEDGHSMVSASSHSDSTLIDITSQRSNATTNASQSQQQYRNVVVVSHLRSIPNLTKKTTCLYRISSLSSIREPIDKEARRLELKELLDEIIMLSFSCFT
uniref:Uncharacterized protein n=1 Tax=Ditylenchus dipsaci TaxID=166011 RepID=A0A915EVS6_9BILA